MLAARESCKRVGEKTGGICLQSGRMGTLIRKQETELSIEETAAVIGIYLTFVSQVEIYLSHVLLENRKGSRNTAPATILLCSWEHLTTKSTPLHTT